MAVFNSQHKLGGAIVTIRNAEGGDAAAMLAMLEQLDTETTFLSREPGEMTMTQEEEHAFLQTAKENPDFFFAVAVLDNRIVGSCSAVLGNQLRTRHTAEMGLGLLKSSWGLGIGKAMIYTCLRWAKEKGVERMRLTVDTQNLRAIGMYLRLGFVVEGTHLRDRKMADGSYRDSYFMSLDLEGWEQP